MGRPAAVRRAPTPVQESPEPEKPKRPEMPKRKSLTRPDDVSEYAAELEKKLAASSQKFAEAAKLSAELKVHVSKIEAFKTSHAGILAQVEAERAAQQAEASRQVDLEAELRAEQRELDESRFKLLREHQAALQALLQTQKDGR